MTGTFSATVRYARARRSPVRRALRGVIGVCGTVGLAAAALQYGSHTPPVAISYLIGAQIVAAGLFVPWQVVRMYRAADRRAAVRHLLLDGALLLATGVFWWLHRQALDPPVLPHAGVYLAVTQVLLMARIVFVSVRVDLSLVQAKLNPARFVALTFLAAILLGGALLMLPKATTFAVSEREGLTFGRHALNCLFTATSAVCVTGLTVYDTGADFSRFGQTVILLLMQIGGLGIMILGSVFGLLAGQQLSLKQSIVLQDALTYQTLGEIRRIVLFIVICTFAVEAAGATLVYSMWNGVDSPWERLYLSVFHSVSAFCNAGFALVPDSLVAYRRAWQVYAVLVPLIVLGGIGFPVLLDLWRWSVDRGRSLLRRRRGVTFSAPVRRGHRASLHTRLVLISSALCVVLGAAGFWLIATLGGEPASAYDVNGPPTLANGTAAGRMLDSLFYSVASRTAGFHTVAMDINLMSPTSHLLGAILMFIGGSPASTAGGVKTVAVAVLFLGLWSTLRGRESVETFGRTIPESVLRRAAVVVMVMFALVSVTTLLLSFTERVTLRAALFESVSACGTVGLSTGLTPELTAPGRIIIMAAMFAGRLGPLTLLIALAGKVRAARYDYPTESVGIG